MSDIQRRETAYRLFAAEFDDATLSHQEADEERAPNYVITPTGGRVNRLFTVGVLTEVEQVNDDVLRGRVVDPTGGFVVYAGQYQPDEMARLEQLDPPTFVAVTGKARTFSPDDSDRVYTSIRPESISEVDADTRDRWVVDAAEQTIERIATYAVAAGMAERGDELRAALESKGVPPGLADGIPRAMDHYGTTPGYLSALRETALDAVRVVSGDKDEVRALSVGPGDEGDPGVTWADLADQERAVFGASPVPAEEAATESEVETESEIEAESGTEGESSAEAESPTEAETGSTSESTTADEPETADESAVAEPAEPSEETDGTAEESPPTADAGTGGAEPETAESSATDTEFVETAEPEEPTESGASTESEAQSSGLGDFEPGDLGGEESEPETTKTDAEPEPAATETQEASTADATPEDAGGGMYEMDDEEREELEDEFGAEFTSGAEVGGPGEADIETAEPEETESETEAVEPDAEAESETAEAAEPETEDVSDAEAEPETEPEAETTADEESAEAEPEADVDLDEYLLTVMAELDEGDGAPRDELVARVTDETGASSEEVEEAIQDALIGGQCYEPGDDRLKAI